MLLKNLIKNLSKEKKKIKIQGLAINSQKIRKGFIFFAIKGKKINGEKYIRDAIKKGAAAVVCSKNCKYNYNIGKTVIIKTKDVRSLLSSISSKFFKSKPKNIIAVTGTNGKTSVADLFFQILDLNKISVASIGTLGIKYKKKTIKSDLTTPDPIVLHGSLEKIKKNKIDNVIIEASSHGLHQKRLDHLNLKAGIFTNLSQDHLDYHGNMKSYFNSKLCLFKNILPKNRNIILDGSIKEISTLKKVAHDRRQKTIDIVDTIKKLKKQKEFKFGNYYLKNLSMAIEAAKLIGLSEKKIFKSIDKIKDVNGRLELVRVYNNVSVFVDFAHTPDALLKVINTLKNSNYRDISLVFGCGGNRDFKKRPLMAKVANSNCNKIYITDDNPRDENPAKIRNEIQRNIKGTNVYNIGNRSKAIKTALLNAEPNETILVAGKGHETTQIYKNKIILISDKKIIQKIKLKIKKKSNKIQTLLQNKQIVKNIQGDRIGNFHGLAIDSREVKKNNLFLTIKGKNNDGVKFINKAIQRGAKYIVTSKRIQTFKKRIIKVGNEINFLNYFAKNKRDRTFAKIIAITGSAGKTSLKNLTADLLSKFGDTLSSPKSYNNHFGVPLSLSYLNAKDKYGIFEVGMSRPGEIHKLTKIIRPHIGVITNIGEAHIENFKNLKGIANAKGEIINNITNSGTLILNKDDKFFNFLSKKARLKKLNIISFGKNNKSDVFPKSIIKNKKRTKLNIKVKDENIKLEFKDLNLYNVLASLAVLKSLNLNLNKIKKLFKFYEPSEGRGKIHAISRYKKKFKLIDESYNANPLSVKTAIKNFGTLKKEKFKKYLLLGDMLELGKKSEMFHKDLSKVINNSDIDKVFITGNKTLYTYQKLNKGKRGNILQSNEDVDFTLNNIIANNDYLMIKGSNATGLNKLSKKLIKGR